MHNQSKINRPGKKRQIVNLSNYNKRHPMRMINQRNDGLRSEEMNVGATDRLVEVESTNTD